MALLSPSSALGFTSSSARPAASLLKPWFGPANIFSSPWHTNIGFTKDDHFRCRRFGNLIPGPIPSFWTFIPTENKNGKRVIQESGIFKSNFWMIYISCKLVYWIWFYSSVGLTVQNIPKPICLYVYIATLIDIPPVHWMVYTVYIELNKLSSQIEVINIFKIALQ